MRSAAGAGRSHNGCMKQQNLYGGGGGLNQRTDYSAANAYDKAGNLLSYNVGVYVGTSYTNYYTYTYTKFDDYKEVKVAGSSSYFQPGETNTSCDCRWIKRRTTSPRCSTAGSNGWPMPARACPPPRKRLLRRPPRPFIHASYLARAARSARAVAAFRSLGPTTSTSAPCRSTSITSSRSSWYGTSSR